jgi:hypothetical protein
VGLSGRVSRLEKECRCRCRSGVVRVVAIVAKGEGEPDPPLPDDLPPPCPVCGTTDGQVVLVVEEVIVRTREDVEAALARNAREGRP